MASTLRNYNDYSQQGDDRDSWILGLSSFAAVLARRLEWRHGMEYEDSYHHMLERALSSWVEDSPDPKAYVMQNIKRGMSDLIERHYARGRVEQRDGTPIEEVYDMANPVDYPVDVMAMIAAKDELDSLPDKNRAVVVDYFVNDVSTKDMEGIGKTTADRYINEYLDKLREKFGVEKVQRRVTVRKEVITLVGPDGQLASGTVSELSKSLGLDNGGLNKVARGKRNHVAGWKLA